MFFLAMSFVAGSCCFFFAADVVVGCFFFAFSAVFSF